MAAIFFTTGSNCYSLFMNRNNKPDLDFLKHIAKEVLTALEYLHRNNVVHRDIRGQFVILSDTGKIYFQTKMVHCQV